MQFSLVHPSIIELYINTLHLHLLQEKLDIIGLDNVTKDFEELIKETTNNFSISVKAAEHFFGSSDVVQNQLNAFDNTMGDM
jgi:hypothetical protein